MALKNAFPNRETNESKITLKSLYLDGSLKLLLEKMQINSVEEKKWLSLWLEMTNKKNDYKLSIVGFRKYLRLDESIWVERTFEIMNTSLSEFVTFYEFISFCFSYIVIDKESTIELCFRLLSRRGTNYTKEYSVLDVDDIKHYLSLQYVFSDRSKIKKRSLDVVIGIAEDGAITIKDFMKYCDINPVFVRFMYRIQNHIRLRLFGMSYWIEKSRILKTVAAGGSLLMMVGGSANIESERYITEHLFDPDTAIIKRNNNHNAGNSFNENNEEDNCVNEKEEEQLKSQTTKLMGVSLYTKKKKFLLMDTEKLITTK